MSYNTVSSGDLVKTVQALCLPTDDWRIVDLMEGDIGVVEAVTDRGAYVLMLRTGVTIWLWDKYFYSIGGSDV